MSELTKHKDLAARYIARGAWGDALKRLRQAQEVAPKDTYVARKIGDTLQRMGRKDKAAHAYKYAAGLFAAAGFLIKAISLNKLILSLRPDDREVQEALTRLYSSQRVQEGLEQAAEPERPGLAISGAEAMQSASVNFEGVETLSIDLAEVDPDTLPWTPLFSDLNADEMHRVIDRMVPVFAAEGTVVCREGEQADSLFVISSGLVRISSRDAKGHPLWLTNLAEGEFFGEFGFFSDGKRHADVLAAEDSELLQIGREEIDAIVSEVPRVGDVLEKFYKVRVVDTLLAKSLLFKSLAPPQRRESITQAALEVHEEGSMIIQEGDDGVSLFVIKSGAVDVHTSLNDKRIALATLKPGDIFGEISLLTGTPTTANVVALSRTELVKFSRREVLALAERHPQIAHLLSETKEHRVHDSVQRIQKEGFV